MIQRSITNRIIENLIPGRAVGLFGPRRTGKTVLMKHIHEKISSKTLMVTGEDLDVTDWEIINGCLGPTECMVLKFESYGCASNIATGGKPERGLKYKSTRVDPEGTLDNARLPL